MAFMDGTVVNVALPAIQRGFDASGADAQWIVESYALFLAALLLVGGALGDRYGRKRVFLVGVVVFTAMSAACAAAQDTGQLIAARALQGIGAALLVPGSLALLGANFPAASRGRAIGTWSAFSGITAAIGPVVGGFLVDHFSWRWVFLLNVPLGIALLFACVAKVPESHTGRFLAAVLDLPAPTKTKPKPAAKKTLLAVYARMEDAAETVSAIIAHPIIPCTLEFLDKTTIACVEDYAKVGLPREAEAILLMESDGHPAVVAEEAEIMAQLARKNGALEVRIAETAEESLRLATARRSAFAALARVAPTTILEDATVPRSELTKMIRFIQEVGARHQLRIGTFGHMGDGNLHPTFLTDERNVDEMARVELAMHEIFDYAIQLGGTITGEHGVGLAKKKYLPESVGNLNVEIMRKLKRLLDPNLILNPGKIFDC